MGRVRAERKQAERGRNREKKRGRERERESGRKKAGVAVKERRLGTHFDCVALIINASQHMCVPDTHTHHYTQTGTVTHTHTQTHTCM